MIWILTLTVGGRTWRASTAPASPVDRFGVAHPCSPTLSPPEITREVGLGDSAVGESGASVECVLPDLDLARLEGRGEDVTSIPAEVALWTAGTAWESRRVVAAGYLDVEDLPTAGEPLTGSVRLPAPDVLPLLPPPAQVISAARFPSYSVPTESIGVSDPYVLGPAGSAPTAYPAVRVPLIDDTPGAQRLLLAGHRVGDTTATIYTTETTTTTTDTWAVEHIQDAAGRWVATVDVSTRAISWTLEGGSAFYWQGVTTGLVYDDGSSIVGLGDLIAWLLRAADADGRTYDLGAWLAARSALNAIAVAGALEEPTDVWQLITEELLPLVPLVGIAAGPHGWAPVILDRRPPLAAPALDVTTIAVSARPAYPAGGGATGLTLRYASSAAHEQWAGSVVIGADRDADAIVTGAARRAASLRRPPVTVALDAAWVASDDSAVQVARDAYWMAATRAPTCIVRVPLDEIDAYPLGRCLRITHTDWGWTARPCWIVAQSMTADDLLLTLRACPAQG